MPPKSAFAARCRNRSVTHVRDDTVSFDEATDEDGFIGRMSRRMSSSNIQRIADDAWRETARAAIASLSRRSGALGDAGRELARVDLREAVLPSGFAALADYLAARAPEGVRKAIVETLDWELHTFRGGRKVETSHRLEAIEETIDAPSQLPAAQPGFDADTAALDLAAPHSMGDLSRYANAYLGRTFVNDAIDHDRIVELHNGSAEEAMASLHARGAKSFHRLATPKLHFQLLLTEIDGALRWAIACDDGLDMFRHLAKVLRASRSESGRHVDAARVARFDHRGAEEASYRPARLRRCFESGGNEIPRQVTVGFKNALLAALGARAARVARVRALQRSSSPPSELRDFDARELLSSATRRAWVDDLLARAGQSPPHPPKLSAVDGPDDFLDHSRLAYLDAKGARREVLLVRNPYGEAAVAMGALFREHGVEDVLVYGTAASLDRAAQVGDLHLASRATSPDGTVHDLDNHALHERFAALHAHPRTHKESRVVNVRSPLDELDREIDRLRAEGHHLIEMELAGLLRGLRGGRARVSVLHVVSDVPQSAHTLESFSPTLAERALDAAVDVWVTSFGIADLELG
jgi:hypothetical protein